MTAGQSQNSMQLQRLDAAHPLFADAMALYEQSFPANERRTREDHIRALAEPDFCPMGAVEDGALLALTFYWDAPGFCYFEHFAVQPALRNSGLGGKLLDGLLQTDKPFILEIEPPEDDLTRRRAHFYERHGLRMQPYDHVQLPFQGGGPIVPLVIMAKPDISPAQCAEFQQYLRAHVVPYTQYCGDWPL